MSKKVNTVPDDEIMTVAEVADYLKMNMRTVYNLAKKGEIPGIRFGRQWRFKKEIIDQIFTQHLEKKTPVEDHEMEHL